MISIISRAAVMGLPFALPDGRAALVLVLIVQQKYNVHCICNFTISSSHKKQYEERS